MRKILALVLVAAVFVLTVPFASGEAALFIAITAQPQSITVAEGAITESLSVTAILTTEGENVVPGQTEGFTPPAGLERQIMPPDLLTMLDGTPVDTPAQWAERQKEIRAMLEFYKYGPAHIGKDDYVDYEVGGSGNNRTLTVNVANSTGSGAISATAVQLPTAGVKPANGWPLIIGLSGVGQGDYARSMGYATMNVPVYGAFSGAFYSLYPRSAASWSTNSSFSASTAWNVSKVIDALLDGAGAELDVNPNFIVVTGTSRNGKYAAAAGALDERITVTMPVVSGMGGVNMGRFNSDNTFWDMYTGPASLQHAPNAPHTDTALTRPPGSHAGIWGSGVRETWSHLVGQNFLGGNALHIANYEMAPVDAHFVAAAAAGKGRYTFMVSGINWESTNGVPGIQYTYDLASPVYEMLGLGNNLAVQIHTVSHGIDQETFVKMFAYLDHMQGKHGTCSGECNMAPYLAGTTADVTSYFTNWKFTIDSLKTTPFKSAENAAVYALCTPYDCGCGGTCAPGECKCENCIYTGIGECCEPGAPPVGEANCILIDFETPETSGLPRSGVGWTPPANGGTVTDGVLTASSTNWNSGVAFTVQLGENFLGDYGKLSFDFSATGGTTGGADNAVSVYAFGQGAIIPSGGWLGDRAGDRIGQIPYVNSATMQTLELNIGGISNQAKNFTDTFRLVIGKNQNPSTFSFGSIKLTAISCNDDCDTCDPASVPSSFTAFVSAASEASTLTYQWFMDGTIIAGAINPTLAIPTGLKAGTYSFHCVVSADGAASVSSKVAVVTVIKYCPLCGEDEESDCECYRDLQVEGSLKDSVTTVTNLDVNSEIVLSGGDTIKIADMSNLILIVSVSDVTDKIEAFFDALLLWLKK